MFKGKESFSKKVEFSLDNGHNRGHPFEASSSQAIAQPATLVLAVDDDDDNLVLIECALELMGVSCAVARTGNEAMELISSRPFSLILLDIVLPDINGIQIIHWLRQQPCTHSIPVIAVTALARSGDRDRIMKAGFTDYLLKPYLLEDLNRLVQRYL